MQPRFGGNRQIACRRGERLVVDETAPHRRLPLSLHRQIARKARTLGPGAALIFARQHSAGEWRIGDQADALLPAYRSEEHTSELQSLMRISYAVFSLKKK